MSRLRGSTDHPGWRLSFPLSPDEALHPGSGARRLQGVTGRPHGVIYRRDCRSRARCCRRPAEGVRRPPAACRLAQRPSPPGAPREGGLEPEECVPAPKADVGVAARRALKSRGSARGALADLDRRRAGQGHGCHCAPSIPRTSQVDEPGSTEAGGAVSAPHPFRSTRGASRPGGERSSLSTKHVSKKAALGRAPEPRSRARTPSPPLFRGAPGLNSSRGAEGRQVQAVKMPLELTQSRVQKIWIPVDHRPSLPRCECGGARGRAAGERRAERGHCAAGAGRALCADSAPARPCGAGRRPPRPSPPALPGSFPASPERGAGLAGARGGDAAPPLGCLAVLRSPRTPGPGEGEGAGWGREAPGTAESLGLGALGQGSRRPRGQGRAPERPPGCLRAGDAAARARGLTWRFSAPSSPHPRPALPAARSFPPFPSPLVTPLHLCQLPYLRAATSSQPRCLCLHRICLSTSGLSRLLSVYLSPFYSLHFPLLSLPLPLLTPTSRGRAGWEQPVLGGSGDG